MKRLALPSVLSLCIVLVASCSNVKNKKITDENKAVILEDMKDTKDLTMDEVHLFDGYLLRRGIKEPGGMTVGQMIEEQRKYRQDAKVREAEDKADKEKARAELDQRRKAISDTVAVTAFEKTTEKAGFIETTTVKFSCQNHGSRDIRGFKGTVAFSDLFGEKLTECPLKEEEVLRAGETRIVSSRDTTGKLRETPLANTRVLWIPEVIVFADGTSLAVEKH